MNSLIFKRAELFARHLPTPLRPVLFAAAGVYWLLGPPLVFLLLMALAALGAWGIGWIVYDWNGRPHNWEARADRALAAQVVNVLQAQRTNQMLFAGLPMGLAEDRFLNTLQVRYRWEIPGPGAMRLNERVGLVYHLDPDGIVTRIQVTAEGIDEQQIMGLMARCLAGWGNPNGTAGEIGGTRRAWEAASWRDERGLVAFDFTPIPGRQPIYRMHLTVISDLDPLFTARSATHGFPPIHRHLAELEENIVKRREQEAANPRAVPIRTFTNGNWVPLRPQEPQELVPRRGAPTDR
jgi:hypothetical protein